MIVRALLLAFALAGFAPEAAGGPGAGLLPPLPKAMKCVEVIGMRLVVPGEHGAHEIRKFHVCYEVNGHLDPLDDHRS
jgi:hypothetical protein